MSILKCKSCGGDLEVKEGDKVVECPYCGSSQTIPNEKDEQILKIYARGNLLRNQGEFDKAYSMFSQLLNSEHEEAETYWNLLLCKYGITYVDDYDGKKKPSMNRMSLSSILDDEDYKKAISLADVVSKETYENEAKKISLIQENIQKIVNRENPYDIFISYKETDEFGDRTKDSLLAQEIYDTLTKEGYKVFLSRVTLSKVIGSEYEPYIFSALYTSKMMLLISTNVDYINSVWVKNEWSRFIEMMKSDKSKTLIPCYRDIDPYDLPKEIRNLQGLDMSKLGFVQDLKIGVEKILGSKKQIVEPINYENYNSNRSNFDTILQRIEMMISQNKFNEAKEKIDHVLDSDPTNALAYFYEFCCDFEINVFDELTEAIEIVDKNDFAHYMYNDNIQSMFKFQSQIAKDKFEKYFLSKYIDVLNSLNDGVIFFDDLKENLTLLHYIHSFINPIDFEFFEYKNDFPNVNKELEKIFGDSLEETYFDNLGGFLAKYRLSLHIAILINENSHEINFTSDNFILVKAEDDCISETYSNIDYIWYEENNPLTKTSLFLIKTKDSKTYIETGTLYVNEDYSIHSILSDVACVNVNYFKNDKIYVFDNGKQVDPGTQNCLYEFLKDEQVEEIKKDVNEILINQKSILNIQPICREENKEENVEQNPIELKKENNNNNNKEDEKTKNVKIAYEFYKKSRAGLILGCVSFLIASFAFVIIILMFTSIFRAGEGIFLKTIFIMQDIVYFVVGCVCLFNYNKYKKLSDYYKYKK